jgi:iron complex outermembrane receptor protein
MLLGTRTQLLASAAVGFAACTPAYAQDPPTSAQTTVSQATNVAPTNQTVTDDNSQAIVVTAQKRAQVLLDVPSSVTVIGGDTLERQQATNFQDYLSLVPGFSINGSTAGVTRLTLRGANTGGVASTVAIFMDDVPVGSRTGLANGAILSGDFDPFDLNRIEVLRGPQGTLYGASSFGGVLRYITNAPKLNRFEARAQAGIEDTAHGGLGYNAAAVVNAPLGDKAAIRVNGFYRKDHGYIDSIGNNPIANFLGGELGSTLLKKDINDKKSYGGRASLLLNPTEAVSVRLTAFAQNLNSGASDAFEADPDTLKPLYGGFVQSRYQPEPTRIKYRVYNGTLDWDLGFANLFSSTAYSTFSEKLETDASFIQDLAATISFLAAIGNPLVVDAPVTRPLGLELFQTTATDKFTQEFRLSSPNNEHFEWLLGAFYTHEKSAIDPQNYFATEFGTDTIATDVKQIAHIFLHSKYDEYAGFANATWHATPRFDFTVGGRLAHNKQRASLLIDSDLLGSAEGNDLNSSETVFTYSVAPRYELSDHASVYARVATGYRPGGPNVIPAGTPPGVPASYGADRLTNWEVGIKAEAPDGHLWSAELAAYHIDWKNIQLFERINNTGINANGGKAKVDGLEASGALRPIPGLTLAANGAYTNGKLKDETPPDTGGHAGDRLPWVPKWSGALHADYDFTLATGTEGFVGASVNYVGRRTTEFGERRADDTLVRIPSYAEFDLRAGVNLDRFRIEAFAHNLFDKRGITDAFAFPSPPTPPSFPNGAAAIGVIRPRTIGLTVTANFDR